MEYSILQAAADCGLEINERTRGKKEVRAKCPYCGDHQGKHHLHLNRYKNMFWCPLCGTGGNSLTLYADHHGIHTKDAFRKLQEAGFHPAETQQEEEVLAPSSRIHDVYYDMLMHLGLREDHRLNLRQRGLNDIQIERMMYRSLPISRRDRMLLAGILSNVHNLEDIPGFFINEDGYWDISGPSGILIPFCNTEGYISYMQVRTDRSSRYICFSSADKNNGTACRTSVHVTGDTRCFRAVLTEGALKGDIASLYEGNALYLCVPGIQNTSGLAEAVFKLRITHIDIAVDMDWLTNPNVRQGQQKIMDLLRQTGVSYKVRSWNPGLNGIDDYLAAVHKAKCQGFDLKVHRNELTDYLFHLWSSKNPYMDSSFITACEWEANTLPLSDIACCPMELLSKDKILQHKAALEKGTGAFAPLVCINRKVAAGKHLYWAYRLLGVKSVQCITNVPWPAQIQMTSAA